MVEKSQITRAERGRAKADKRRKKRKALEVVEQQEAALRESLATPKRTLKDGVEACLPAALRNAREREGFLEFFLEVVEKAPRLMTSDWGEALHALWIAALGDEWNPIKMDQDYQWRPRVRGVQDWTPKVKGARSCFRSLAKHLLEKYPQPQILWTALEEPHNAATQLAPVVFHVAQGRSLAKAPENIWPFGLSKKQCHNVLNTTGMSFLTAIRHQQMEPFGGTPRLAKAWMAQRRGTTVGTKTEEAFWVSVMAFFAKNPMLDHAQIGPIVDYIQWIRGENPNFSMKGRTAGALLRDVEQWHVQLHRVKATDGARYNPSGFPHYVNKITHRDKTGNHIEVVWSITEILTGKDLASEGRALHHCVYSYSGSIQRGAVSIWSMTKKEMGQLSRCLTMEVVNRSRQIVQARGLRNRRPENDEFRVMKDWADKAGLSTGTYL
jgi:hypothetical protein